MSGPVLEVRGLCAGYGAIQVVENVDLTVAAGELVCMVGRNGAGKSTSLAAIAGQRRSRTSGEVRLTGVEVSRRTPSQIFRQGLAFVPEGHRVFPDLTVEENIVLGFRPRRAGRPLPERMEEIFGLFGILGEFAQRPAGRLSGGQQQMVAIAQALMADPVALLLDEPSSGLAPIIVDAIYVAILAMRAAGRALLVVEQNVDRALANADTVVVLDGGRIVASGTPSELSKGTPVADIVRGTANMVRDE
jgi:branched-chain amino acid transport system ATP-binding protein